MSIRAISGTYRVRIPLVAIAALTVFAFCPGARASAKAPAPFHIAQLTEETLPAESLPSTATPSAVPGTPASTPTATVSPPAPTPSATATPPLSAEASPTATPPPFEIGSIMPAPPLSGESLAPLIKIAAQTMPARAASMRLADRAREAIEHNHPASALRLLGRAVSIDPSDPYAYFYLGRAYTLKKNYSQAVVFFERAQTYFGSDSAWSAETLSFEGAAYEQAGDLLKAKSAYQQALTAEPNNLMALVGYSRVAQAIEPQTATPETAPPAGANLAPPAEPAPGPPPTEPQPAPAPTSGY